MDKVRAYKHPKGLIYIANTQTQVGILVSSDRPYGAPTGTFGSGDLMINLWYLLGWLVDQGVAN